MHSNGTREAPLPGLSLFPGTATVLGDGYGQRQRRNGGGAARGRVVVSRPRHLRVAAMACVSTSLGVCFSSVRRICCTSPSHWRNRGARRDALVTEGENEENNYTYRENASSAGAESSCSACADGDISMARYVSQK